MSITRSMKELSISESHITSGNLRKLSMSFGGRVVKIFVAPKTKHHGSKELSRAILKISVILQSLAGLMIRSSRHCDTSGKENGCSSFGGEEQDMHWVGKTEDRKLKKVRKQTKQ